MVFTPIVAINFLIVAGLLIIFLLVRREGSRLKEIPSEEEQAKLLRINHKHLAFVTLIIFLPLIMSKVNFITSALAAAFVTEIYAYLTLKSRINILVAEHCGE